MSPSNIGIKTAMLCCSLQHSCRRCAKWCLIWAMSFISMLMPITLGNLAARRQQTSHAFLLDYHLDKTALVLVLVITLGLPVLQLLDWWHAQSSNFMMLSVKVCIIMTIQRLIFSGSCYLLRLPCCSISSVPDSVNDISPTQKEALIQWVSAITQICWRLKKQVPAWSHAQSSIGGRQTAHGKWCHKPSAFEASAISCFGECLAAADIGQSRAGRIADQSYYKSAYDASASYALASQHYGWVSSVTAGLTLLPCNIFCGNIP